MLRRRSFGGRTIGTKLYSHFSIQYRRLRQLHLTPKEEQTARKLISIFDESGPDSAVRYPRKEREEDTDVGLYGIRGLTSPASWNVLCDNTIRKIEQLIEKATTKSKENQRHPKLQTKVEILKALDGISSCICSVVDPAELCRHTHPDPAFVAAAEDIHTRLSTKIHELNTNVDVYNAITSVTDDADPEEGFHKMTEEQQIVAHQLKVEFELNGIHLPEEERRKVVALQSRITDLTYEFGMVIRANETLSNKVLEVDVTRLKGLSPDLIKRLPKGKPPGTVQVECNPWICTEILRQVEEEELRKQVFTLTNSTHSKRALRVLEELLRTRDRLAKVLHFPSFAALNLSSKMAKNSTNVSNFLDELSTLIKSKANEEMAMLQTLKANKEYERTGKLNKGVNIYAWDKAYFTSLAASQTSWNLREYFSLGHCIAGLNLVTSRLFGISLEVVPMHRNESWDRHVKKVKLTHETEGLVGYVYLDLFPRPGKFNSAANFAIEFAYVTSKADALKEGRKEDEFLGTTLDEEDEGYLVPKVALVCNFDEPISVLKKPSLLSHDEMETLFHEFGHTLSNLLSRTRFQHTAGTRGQLDFVETPSTLMEYFAFSSKVLPLFAKHYRTEDPIQEKDIQAIQNNKAMFSALSTQQQILYSVVDQVYHGPHPLPKSMTELLVELHNKYTNFPLVEGTNWPASFGHLGGYGASYYSYLYSRVFSANMWHNCFEKESTPLSRSIGERYRQTILAHGGAKDPIEMIEKFLGGKPSLAALSQSFC